MSNNKQELEMTGDNAPLLPATFVASTSNLDSAEKGEHRGNNGNKQELPAAVTGFATCSTSTPIVDETMCLLLYSAESGQNRKQRQPSICKVSIILRNLSEESFNPQMVYIGPIHRKDPKLQECEKTKERYLSDLLTRCDKPKEAILEACVLEINGLIPQIRDSYDGVIKNCNDVELARMMIMDGCFILEFCFKHVKGDEYLPNKMDNRRIAMDLILLENQVPFVVLQTLFGCLAPHVVTLEGPVTLGQILDAYLAPYVNKLFRSQLRVKISTTDVDSNSTHDHLLGYLHKRYQLDAAKSSKPKHAEEDEERISFHSIVELDRSGMNFKPHQEDEWSLTIKFQSSLFSSLPWFWGTPSLLMPTLVIGDFTELIFRNFIAYEQPLPEDRCYFTSYANVMNKLIDTKEDIAKLVESKVLVNHLGSDKEAADMINKLCKKVSVTDFYYTGEFKQVDEYYNRFWPQHIAYLRRVYFSNPCSIIGLLAAMILFGVAVVGIIFDIKGK